MAVSPGVFLQVALMILLRQVVVLQRPHLGDHRLLIFLLHLRHHLAGYLQISRFGGVDPGAILGPAIVALTIFAGRIDNPEKMIEKLTQADCGRVVSNLYRFDVSSDRDLLVLGVSAVSVGIAYRGAQHPFKASKVGLHPPEAAAGQPDLTRPL
jgi:hypothetical protein